MGLRSRRDRGSSRSGQPDLQGEGVQRLDVAWRMNVDATLAAKEEGSPLLVTSKSFLGSASSPSGSRRWQWVMFFDL
ncbi:hypothetical protein TanjilG_28525 [Lupinus angustifolius]|uniref:Uncharacterized protein n=1 Tax=Lupinus angustifolius TaxID=3871 RepID=A0A394DCK8_LUPAN|nr:hypothetical protein TanjilG_28525 [Lupinus angustifolius]